jgi:preprotein translocase SecE subunit
MQPMSAEKLGEEKESRRRRLPVIQRTKVEEPARTVGERGLAKNRPTPSTRRRHEEEDDGNIIERTRGGLSGYVEGVREELQKVAWPSPEETRRLTIIVVATLIAAALILGIISAAFTELFRIGLNAPIVLLGVMAIAIVAGVVISRVNKRSSV